MDLCIIWCTYIGALTLLTLNKWFDAYEILWNQGFLIWSRELQAFQEAGYVQDLARRFVDKAPQCNLRRKNHIISPLPFSMSMLVRTLQLRKQRFGSNIFCSSSCRSSILLSFNWYPQTMANTSGDQSYSMYRDRWTWHESRQVIRGLRISCWPLPSC